MSPITLPWIRNPDEKKKGVIASVLGFAADTSKYSMKSAEFIDLHHDYRTKIPTVYE